MERRALLIPLFAVPSVILASPFNPYPSETMASGNSACLAVLLVVLVLVLLLMFLKHMYMRNRRLRQPSILTQTGLDSKQLQANRSIFAFPTIENGENGYLVGVFGSPCWETKNIKVHHQNSTSPLKLMKKTDLSYRHRVSPLSSTPPGDRSPDDRAVKDGALFRSTKDGIAPPRSPASPPQAHIQSCRRASIWRRASFPMAGANKNLMKWKRHFTLKLKKDATFSPVASPSLRLVEPLPVTLDTSLPFCHKHRDLILTDVFEEPPHNLVEAKQSSKLPSDPRNAAPPVHADEIIITDTSGNFFSTIAGGASNKLSMIKADFASIMQVSSETAARAREIPDYPNFPSKHESPNFADRQRLLCMVNENSIQSKDARMPVVRSRRTPPIAPSPLKSLTSPESQYNATNYRPVQTGLHNRPRTGYDSIGLGLPPRMTTQATNSAHGIVPGMERPVSPRRSQSTFTGSEGDRQSESLLGIIRELVQEASEWDPSFFMDQKFKTLIQESGLVPLDTRGGTALQRNYVSRLESILEDKSAEMDLDMLGIEVFAIDDSSVSGSTSASEALLPIQSQLGSPARC